MFSHVATFDDGIPHLQGITDLEVVTVGETVMLYTGSEADGGLSAFSLTAGGPRSIPTRSARPRTGAPTGFRIWTV